MPSLALPLLLAAGFLVGFGVGWLLQSALDRRLAETPPVRTLADRLADLETRVARLEEVMGIGAPGHPPPAAGTS